MINNHLLISKEDFLQVLSKEGLKLEEVVKVVEKMKLILFNNKKLVQFQNSLKIKEWFLNKCKIILIKEARFKKTKIQVFIEVRNRIYTVQVKKVHK